MEGEAESCEEVKPITTMHEVNGGNSVENDVVKPGAGHYPNFSRKQLPQKDVGAVTAWPPGLNATSLAPSQLTIFYGGSVFVFNGIHMEKVREIILVAPTATTGVATAPIAAANNYGDEKNTIQ